MAKFAYDRKISMAKNLYTKKSVQQMFHTTKTKLATAKTPTAENPIANNITAKKMFERGLLAKVLEIFWLNVVC